MQKKGEINNVDRNEMACDAEAKIDYGNLVIYVNICWNNRNIYIYVGGGAGDQTNSLQPLCSQCIKLPWKAMTITQPPIITRCGLCR